MGYDPTADKYLSEHHICPTRNRLTRSRINGIVPWYPWLSEDHWRLDVTIQLYRCTNPWGNRGLVETP